MRGLYLLFALILISHSTSSACDETIKLGDSTYTISDEWCGKEIDTSDVPKYEDLGQIPKEFTYKESKIYITKEARDAFVEMAEAAKIDSVNLLVQSGFRSRGYQAKLVRDRLEKGKKFSTVIKYVAPPGYSEHELGNSIDLKSPGYLFSKSDAYAWLKENGEKYGFIERYPKDNDHLKSWEPWHWAYDPTILK